LISLLATKICKKLHVPTLLKEIMMMEMMMKMMLITNSLITRYAHARIREYAESIAFYKGEPMEKWNTEQALGDVISNQKRVAKWQLIVECMKNEREEEREEGEDGEEREAGETEKGKEKKRKFLLEVTKL
jgi:hypothetical protein